MKELMRKELTAKEEILIVGILAIILGIAGYLVDKIFFHNILTALLSFFTFFSIVLSLPIMRRDPREVSKKVLEVYAVAIFTGALLFLALLKFLNASIELIAGNLLLYLIFPIIAISFYTARRVVEKQKLP
jgi:ABC-type iron transport system FetAB permease component